MYGSEESKAIKFSVLLSVIICWLNSPVHALAGDTNSYVFLPDQSTVTQTGGFAGVNETYPISGQFHLTVDANAGVASFNIVDANLLNPTGFLYTQSLDDLFNMTELQGTIVNQDLIEFSGKASDDSDLALQITITNNIVQLTGQTTPPPGSADFFIFHIDALAQKKYSGGSGTPEDPYQIATAQNLIALGNDPNDYDKHFILTSDIDLDPNLPGGKVFDGAVIAPDLNDREIRFQGHTFTGAFYGQDHTIANLVIDSNSSHAGLFGMIGSGGRVCNLRLVSGYVQGQATSGRGHTLGGTGGLAGENRGLVTACSCELFLRGLNVVGGLVGRNYGSITACYSTGSVSGNWSVSGLVGANFSGSIASSYSTGSVSGNWSVGGLVGANSSGSITSSFWDTETSGQSTSVGGTGLTTAQMQTVDPFLKAGWDFAGQTVDGTCEYWQMQAGDYPSLAVFSGVVPITPQGSGTPSDPYRITNALELGAIWYRPVAYYRLDASIDLANVRWTGAVVPWFDGHFDGNGHVISNLRIRGAGYLGLFGILGLNASLVDLGLETMDINGTGDRVGGLVGYNYGSITASYSTGSVSGDRYIGGLVGDNNGSITASYSTGSVSGVDDIGGLVGCNYRGSITASYSTGSVSGDSRVGGLVGRNFGSITGSFWDTETSGINESSGGIGLTTVEMYNIDTYLDEGWDFIEETINGTDDIWWIDNGNDYPRLWWEQ